MRLVAGSNSPQGMLELLMSKHYFYRSSSHVMIDATPNKSSIMVCQRNEKDLL